jgi:pantoate--beta-alanine ligase
MKIVGTIKELQNLLDEFRAKNLQIGFVPTMGALHLGHISLLKQSLSENNITICSIFVNPAQFNNSVDLQNYPRTIDNDILLLEKENCSVLFIPNEKEIYPSEYKPLDIELNGLDIVMEGKFRPGHFSGMITVVKRLFDIINPTKAYFGKKDYQQLKIIQRMTLKFQLPIEIIACDTLREADGLAMSSRNTRLTSEQRKNAPIIYKALQEAKQNFFTQSIEKTKEVIVHQINSANGFKVEYVEIAHSETLTNLQGFEKENAMAFVACFVGEVRLIDNIHLS